MHVPARHKHHHENEHYSIRLASSHLATERGASDDQGLTQVAHRSPPPRQNGLLQPFSRHAYLRQRRAPRQLRYPRSSPMRLTWRARNATPPRRRLMSCPRRRLRRTSQARPAAIPTRLAARPSRLCPHCCRRGSLSCPAGEAGDALKTPTFAYTPKNHTCAKKFTHVPDSRVEKVYFL